jgi:hypothetical protein
MALRKAYPQDAWDGLGRQVSLLTEASMLGQAQWVLADFSFDPAFG